MSWDKLLSPGIPVADASAFFLEMTKKAEWTDPPDMTGELEGQFAAPVEQVLHMMKAVIAMKFRLMVAYGVYAESFTDHAWRALKMEFMEHAEDEQAGAQFYVKRATVLGGPVLMDDVAAPPPSTNPQSILEMLARGEQEAIAAQRVLRQAVGDDNPMKIGIEEQMMKDQHHLDELFQMMNADARLALEQAGAETVDPAMDPAAGASPTAISNPTTDPALAPEPEMEEPAGPPVADPKVAEAIMKMAMSKEAFLGTLGLIMAGSRGIQEGKRVAGQTAAAIAPTGRVLRSEEIAKSVASAGATVGVLGGLLASGALTNTALRNMPMAVPEAIIRYGVPIAAMVGGGMAGGLASGAAVGGIQQLRGPLHPDNDKTKKQLAKEQKALAKTAADKTDDELKETGRQRAVTSLAAEAHRERGSRGERYGELLGSLGGAVGGAALGRKHMPVGFGGPLAGTVAGAVGGYMGGKRLGKEVGNEIDIHKNAAAFPKATGIKRVGELLSGSRAKSYADALESHKAGTNKAYKDAYDSVISRVPKGWNPLPMRDAASGAGHLAIKDRHAGKLKLIAGGADESRSVGRARAAAGGVAAAGAVGTAAALHGEKNAGIFSKEKRYSFIELHPKNEAAKKLFAEHAARNKTASINEAVAIMAAAMKKHAEELGADGGMSAPSAGQLEPTNYLRAEMVARRAQEMNEANFYREQLSQTKQQTVQSGQQMADLQMQLQQAQQQQAQVDAQLQQYAQQAAQAQAQASQSAMEAANATMAAHQFRANILQAASQDPGQLGMPPAPGAVQAQHDQAQTALAPPVDPNADPNAAAAAQPGQPPPPSGPDQTTQQTAQTGQAEAVPGQPKTEVTKSETTKTSSLAERLVGAGLGAASATGKSLLLGQSAGRLRDQVEQLGPNQSGSFFEAARQASMKAQLAGAEFAQKYPTGAAAMAGVGGAIGGALAGPALAGAGRHLFNNVQSLRG